MRKLKNSRTRKHIIKGEMWRLLMMLNEKDRAEVMEDMTYSMLIRRRALALMDSLTEQEQLEVIEYIKGLLDGRRERKTVE